MDLTPGKTKRRAANIFGGDFAIRSQVQTSDEMMFQSENGLTYFGPVKLTPDEIARLRSHETRYGESIELLIATFLRRLLDELSLRE